MNVLLLYKRSELNGANTLLYLIKLITIRLYIISPYAVVIRPQAKANDVKVPPIMKPK